MQINYMDVEEYDKVRKRLPPVDEWESQIFCVPIPIDLPDLDMFHWYELHCDPKPSMMPFYTFKKVNYNSTMVWIFDGSIIRS